MKDGTVIPSPPCAGDTVVFPSPVTYHRVTSVESGHRHNLVWWAHGEPPVAMICPPAASQQTFLPMSGSCCCSPSLW